MWKHAVHSVGFQYSECVDELVSVFCYHRKKNSGDMDMNSTPVFLFIFVYLTLSLFALLVTVVGVTWKVKSRWQYRASCFDNRDYLIMHNRHPLVLPLTGWEAFLAINKLKPFACYTNANAQLKKRIVLILSKLCGLCLNYTISRILTKSLNPSFSYSYVFVNIYYILILCTHLYTIWQCHNMIVISGGSNIPT